MRQSIAFGAMTWCVCSFVAGAALAQPTVADPDWRIQTYATEVSLPTGFAFAGEDELFVIERRGEVHYIAEGHDQVVLDLDVMFKGRGLLGIALHPQFQSNGQVYLYYSATTAQGDTIDEDTWLETRLSRFTWNGSSLTNERVLGVFGSPNDGFPDKRRDHSGGPIVFGPDGKLYGITGDLGRNAAEQNVPPADRSAMVGGIYRLNPDGTIPSDNPFTSNPNEAFHRWYAYGVRNSFGLAFDPETGMLWDTENGPASYDEINLVESGFNSGWQKIMGPDDRDEHNVDDLVSLGDNAFYSDPEFSFKDSIGITGIEFLAASAFGPEYEDAVLVADVVLEQIYLLQLNDSRTGFVFDAPGLQDLVADTEAERKLLRFGQGFGKITQMRIGPDGALYVASFSQGKIYRLSPQAIPTPTAWAMGLVLLGGVAMRQRRRS